VPRAIRLEKAASSAVIDMGELRNVISGIRAIYYLLMGYKAGS
jgi:hypothetical protein